MIFLQSATNHILTANKSASAQQVNHLEGQLERERHLVEILEAKQKTLVTQLDAVTRRESELREEVSSLEKNLTILKHDLKEVKKSVNYELL